MQAQRKPAKARSPRRHPALRPEFTAAVRFLDGSQDIFHVRFADDIDDARQVVLSQLGEVRSLVISQRQARA